MTEIRYSKGKNFKLEISGHCGFSLDGKDIVCSAVSILVETLVNRLEDLPESQFKKPIKIEKTAGQLYIKASPKSEINEQIEHWFDLIVYGLKLVAYNYPSYVKFL